MKSLLIRCYPARWRARYEDEFLAILEERPLGPFDVADILLGALDARLRSRGRVAGTNQGRGFAMSLRIGGTAAILGGAALAMSILVGIGIGNVDPVVAGILLVTGMLALLVALAGLSAFQGRVHPVLSWAAVAITGAGAITVIISGILAMQLFTDGYWYVFILGMLGALVGSTLFAIATYQTAVLSRGAALLLGVGSVLMIVAGLGSNALGPIPLIVTSICFALGWFALGINAVRLDRPSAAPRPA